MHTLPSTPHSGHDSTRIDWSQLWYPGPRRMFTPAELARAGGDPPSRTFVVMLVINLAVLALVLMWSAPAGEGPRVAGLLVAIFMGAYQGAMRLWRRPSRRLLLQVSMWALPLFLAFAFGLKWRMDAGPARDWLFFSGWAAFVAGVIGFWFVTVYRAQQIEARLRELDERDRAVALARQLATAQVKPHFMFNTLASLQHWVDTGDKRAGPMLQSLTAYLRATLPLFERPELTLAQELEAVQRYLEVMQARWGARLRWQVQADDDAALRDAALPPGALLTLVENAVEHGVGARLGGGEVSVSACRRGDGQVQVDVRDDGPGCANEAGASSPANPSSAAPSSPHPSSGGLGLANTRARMAQAFGEAARLSLSHHPEGGCLARLEWPCRPMA
jgi:signal transduction histidine kinase